jgi:hypothetical protein
MFRPTRRLRVFAGAVGIVGIGILTACSGGGGEKPSETATTPAKPSPTSKAVTPGGPNGFSSTPVAPLSPTVNPGQNGAPRASS